ncbi:MAG: hypothetical protein K2N29_03465, partial [Ruminiclostridium sp.]|nr:hypothetical protein [Ruminiclostridium sp.]
ARNDSLDDSIGLYDAQVRRNPSIERTDVLEITAPPQSPLFLGPKRRPIETQQKQFDEPMPLSQKKLNDAIAAAKAAREHEEETRRRADTVTEIRKTRASAAPTEKPRETEERIRQSANYTNESFSEAIKTAESRISETIGIPLSEEESVKQYTPRKPALGVPHATSAIPRPDALFNDESDGVSYNIDDILAGLEHK